MSGNESLNRDYMYVANNPMIMKLQYIEQKVICVFIRLVILAYLDSQENVCTGRKKNVPPYTPPSEAKLPFNPPS